MHTERKIPGGKMQKAATAEGNKKIYWHKKRKKKLQKIQLKIAKELTSQTETEA